MIVAGTGHRPGKVGGYGEDAFMRLVGVAEGWLRSNPNVSEVISGMALGWDQALAQAAINVGVPFAAYVAFVGQEGKWPASSQAKFHALCKRASRVVVCASGGYAVSKMQTHSERMVEDSNMVLALWDGTPSGTKNCVDYARSVGREIVNVWQDWVTAGEEKENAMVVIDRFIGEYRFLSNFWPAEVTMYGVTYPTVEHAYQAGKAADAKRRKEVLPLTAAQTKSWAKSVKLRPDWEQFKLTAMNILVRRKFEIATLRELLLATGDAALVEGNTWGDRFWGVCRGVGENHLGKILMVVRDECHVRV